MKKLLKLFMMCVVCVAFLAACGADTNEIVADYGAGLRTGDFHFTQLQVRDIESYIPHLAEQIREFNRIAPVLWVDNPVVDVSFLMADSELERFWMINPDGYIEDLTFEQATAHGFPEDMEFLLFTFFEDGSGIYMRFSDDVVTDEFAAERALLNPHRGGPFTMLTFGIHELFHHLEQGRHWAENMELPEDMDAFYEEFFSWSEEDQEAFMMQVQEAFPNLDREEFLENAEARAVRHTMLRQIFRALADLDDEGLVLDLLATYEHYRTNFPEEHHMSVQWDRIEGTAQYFDVLAALMAVHFVAFEDVDRAVAEFAVLADSQDSFIHYGLVKEGYIMGWAGFLLNRYIEPSVWQQRFVDDTNATFLGILSEQINEPLPAFTPMTAVERAAFDVRLAEEIELMAEAAQLYLGGAQNLSEDDGVEISFHDLGAGFSLTFPADWDGKIGFEDIDQVEMDYGTRQLLEVFHLASRMDGFPGTLFTIGMSPSDDYTEEEPPIWAGVTIILAQEGGSTYFVNFPSGVTHNEAPSSASGTEYLEMVDYGDPGFWDFLVESFRFLN